MAGVASAWQLNHNERERAIATVVALVEAGQRSTVKLVDAYMVAAAREAGLRVPSRGLNGDYSIEALRGVAAAEVYGRPFGALGGQLEQGASLEQALASARGYVTKLAQTDLQLAHTHASRDWMAGDHRIVGYRRVLGFGDHCSLCRSASTRTYSKADLMPIHERCHCSVAPVFGKEPVASVGTTVQVVDDPELGPRLIADSWSPMGPTLDV